MALDHAARGTIHLEHINGLVYSVVMEYDANRTVRSALNDSLNALARAYEEEIGRARAQIEADDRLCSFS